MVILVAQSMTLKDLQLKTAASLQLQRSITQVREAKLDKLYKQFVLQPLPRRSAPGIRPKAWTVCPIQKQPIHQSVQILSKTGETVVKKVDVSVKVKWL